MKRRGSPLLDRPSCEIFHAAHSWQEVTRSLEDVRLSDHERIHALVVASSSSLDELLLSRASASLRAVTSQDDFTLYSYTKTFGKTKQHRLSGEFAVSSCQDLPAYVVLSCAPPIFIRDALGPLFDSLYPRLMRPFLSQSELHDLLKAFQRGVQPNVLRIQEFSAKRRLSSARRRFESLRDWTDTDPEAAFREAKERNVWFSSVRFEVVRRHEGPPGAWAGVQGRFSKYGEASVDGGYRAINELVLPYLIRVTTDRLKLFSNRDRVTVPLHAVKPLEIAYDRPVLKTTEDARRLLESLKRLPRGTCTVLHANPYLHVSLVDDLDFSASDIWVLSQSKILVVPQLRASYGSLRRIVNHIFENFAEGKVGEAKTT
jgi:hypothetical protein